MFWGSGMSAGELLGIGECVGELGVSGMGPGLVGLRGRAGLGSGALLVLPPPDGFCVLLSELLWLDMVDFF